MLNSARSRDVGLGVLLLLSACPASVPNPPADAGPSPGSEVFTEQVIDSAGGEIFAQGVRLSIPKGALPGATTIRISTRPAPDMTPPVGTDRISMVYRLEPEGLTFSSSITITLPIDPIASRFDEQPGDGLILFTAPHGTADWRPIGATSKSGEDRIVGRTSHFSDFMVALFRGSGCGFVTECNDVCGGARCEGTCTIHTPARDHELQCWRTTERFACQCADPVVPAIEYALDPFEPDLDHTLRSLLGGWLSLYCGQPCRHLNDPQVWSVFPNIANRAGGTKVRLETSRILEDSTILIGGQSTSYLRYPDTLQIPGPAGGYVRVPAQVGSVDSVDLEIRPPTDATWPTARLAGGLTYGTCTDAVIARMYVDTVGRNVDPAGLLAMRPLADHGARAAVIVGSAEVVTQRLAQAYLRLLGRRPSSGELALFISLITSGATTVEETISTIAASPEAWGRARNDPMTYVHTVVSFYAFASAGPEHHRLYMSSPSRADFVRAVRQLPETHRETIRFAYSKFLDREPDAGALVFWGERLRSLSASDFWRAILSSTEYLGGICATPAAPDAGVVDSGEAPYAAEVDTGIPADTGEHDSGPEVSDSGPNETPDSGVGPGPAPTHDVSLALNPGGTRTCAISNAATHHRLACWGAMGNGAFGDGATGTRRRTPVQVRGPGGAGFLENVISVGVGLRHTCASLEDGSAWCWGENLFGELGDGTYTPSDHPVRVLTAGPGSAPLAGVRHVIAGGFAKGYACALLSTGRVVCWGGNDWGQIPTQDPLTVLVADRPVDSGLDQVTKLAGGMYHMCVIRTADKNVWCWGSAADWELGVPSAAGYLFTPQRVLLADNSTPFSGAEDIATGHRHTCAAKSDGSAWCWGHAGDGKLGDGMSTDTTRMAAQVLGVGGTGFLSGVRQISAATRHSCATTGTSTYCWGDNRVGALGDGSQNDSPTPVAVIGGSTFIEVLGSLDYTCGRAADHTAWCWGDNTYEVLGQSAIPFNESLVPVAVQGL